jgi:glycosyltransferase involved in cell wall biosynthesis
MDCKASIIIPAYNEGIFIRRHIERLFDRVKSPVEVIVVVDDSNDTTLPVIKQLTDTYPKLRAAINTLGPGPANAIKYGFAEALGPVLVVTMADGCDDPAQIDELIDLVDRGVAIAAASRYMPGGQQVGGPFIKALLSKLAGKSLRVIRNSGTNDATNSFKAYSRDFLEMVKVESSYGFEMGLELVAKAIRLRQPVAEIPTIWLDRTDGASNFKLVVWLPKYLKWYLYAFGPKMRKQVRE